MARAAMPMPAPQSAAVDPELITMRHAMREKILEYLQRKAQNVDVRKKLVDTTNRLEERILKGCTDKNDYLNKLKGDIGPLLQAAIRTSQQNSQTMSHRISSSSTYGGIMIPTAGIPQSSSGNSTIVAGVIPCNVNIGGMLSASASTNLSGVSQGPISNGYQLRKANASLNKARNNMVSSVGSLGRQQSQPQMMPTPGLSNQRNLGVNLEYFNGLGYFGAETALSSQLQQQRQLNTNPGTHSVQHPGSQVSTGGLSGVQPKIFPYGISGKAVNNDPTLVGHASLANGPALSDGYINGAAYSNSPKGLQQNHNQLHSQLIRISASGNRQVVSAAVGDVKAVKATEASYPGALFSSAPASLSSSSSLSRNATGFHTNPIPNVSFPIQQLVGPQMIPLSQAKNQIVENLGGATLQRSQISVEHLLNSQRFGHQNSLQSNNSPYQFVRDQSHLVHQQQPIQQSHLVHQQQPIQQQHMSSSNSTMQSSLGPGHVEKAMPEQAMQAPSGVMLSEVHEQCPISHVQQKGLYDSSKIGQLHNQVSGSHHLSLPALDSQYHFSSQKQSGESLSEVNSILRVSQTDFCSHAQWQVHSLENTLASGNSLTDKHAQEDLRQWTMLIDEAQ